jgi:hypothetical protein
MRILLSILGLLLTISTFAKSFQLPTPDPAFDEKQEVESRGNLELRKKLALEYVDNFSKRYVEEFKKLNPETPNPFETTDITQQFKSAIDKTATVAELSRPMNDLYGQLKAAFDEVALSALTVGLTPEETVSMAINHEIRLAKLEGLLSATAASSRILNASPTGPTPETDAPVAKPEPAKVNVQTSAEKSFLDNYGLYLALALSALSLGIVLTKK